MILETEAFAAREEEELQKAGFRAKPKTVLTEDKSFDFNGGRVILKDGKVILTQKNQGKKLALVDLKANDREQQYVEQRARGAYIASICQPEAAFDMSVAAQAQIPTEGDIKLLNKRIQWQLDNLDRGLTYVALDLSKAKLFVFADGSFANNKDLSSQIGYVIVLAEETMRTEISFSIKGNTITHSSVKSKRVVRSTLAGKTNGVVIGFDIAICLSATLARITERLGLPRIPLILCTDSKSLYECLVKLNTTSEKRLMIDVMALRQSYERREIEEIRWIRDKDNSADAMTKDKCNTALTRLIDSNELTVSIEAYVRRPGKD